jgi:hypothetical protein
MASPSYQVGIFFRSAREMTLGSAGAFFGSGPSSFTGSTPSGGQTTFPSRMRPVHDEFRPIDVDASQDPGDHLKGHLPLEQFDDVPAALEIRRNLLNPGKHQGLVLIINQDDIVFLCHLDSLSGQIKSYLIRKIRHIEGSIQKIDMARLQLPPNPLPVKPV